jgi:hypothetical protein
VIGRRGWLKGLLVMTFPGLGGQQPPPQNAAPSGQLTPGVTPGVTGQVIARRVIIVGANGEFLVYNPAIAAGDLAVSIAGVAGTGLAGDTVEPGVVAYDSSGDYAQLFSAALNFLIIGMAQAAGLSLTGEAQLQVTSGQAGAGDIASGILLQSATAAGGSSTITLNAALTSIVDALTVGGNATVDGNLTVDGTLTATLSGTTGGPNGTGFFNTQGLASGSYGSTHQHTLPDFPTATHDHDL